MLAKIGKRRGRSGRIYRSVGCTLLQDKKLLQQKHKTSKSNQDAQGFINHY